MSFSIALNSGDIDMIIINGLKANRQNTMLNFKSVFIYYNVLSKGTAEMFRM